MTSNRRSEGDPENPETPSMAETRNWLELPPDVTSTILQKLNSFEILENAQKVCPFWRSLCKDPSMWRFIDMGKDWLRYEDDVKVTKMTMHAVDLSCGQLLDITLVATGSTELIKYIADRAPLLRCIRVRGCYDDGTDQGLIHEAKKLPKLEELELSLCDITKEGLEAVGRNCPLLKSLKLNNHPHGHLGYCDKEALAIAESMPELRHLQLLGNSCTNVGLKAILDGCPHLESLDLRQCSFVALDQELEKVCAERIKDLLHPGDSVAGCGYPLSDKNYRPYNLPDDDTVHYFDDEHDEYNLPYDYTDPYFDDDDDDFCNLYDGDYELYLDADGRYKYAIFF